MAARNLPGHRRRAKAEGTRKTGSIVATCTKLTITGEGASDVISHPAPVFWTHSPVLLASVAIPERAESGMA
jgi:hypothetical protein